MTMPREIRRLAFQALYQLDARTGEDAGTVLSAVGEDEESRGDGGGGEEMSKGERREAIELAKAAYAARAEADAFMVEAAPGWPVHRQAAVDRAILRLAHFEMVSERVPAKVAVNEAVELAKIFSTDKSPSFVNGLLDKLLKKVLGDKGEPLTGEGVEDEPAPAQDAGEH